MTAAGEKFLKIDSSNINKTGSVIYLHGKTDSLNTII